MTLHPSITCSTLHPKDNKLKVGLNREQISPYCTHPEAHEYLYILDGYNTEKAVTSSNQLSTLVAYVVLNCSTMLIVTHRIRVEPDDGADVGLDDRADEGLECRTLMMELFYDLAMELL